MVRIGRNCVLWTWEKPHGTVKFHCRSDSHSHPNQVIATMTEDFVYILFCLQEGSDFTPTKRYDVHYYSYSPLIMTVAVELAPVGSFGVALRCSIIICSLLWYSAVDWSTRYLLLIGARAILHAPVRGVTRIRCSDTPPPPPLPSQRAFFENCHDFFRFFLWVICCKKLISDTDMNRKVWWALRGSYMVLYSLPASSRPPQRQPTLTHILMYTSAR